VIMLIFGCLGYLMKKYGYDAAPMMLAFVLGPLVEINLRQALMISKGKFSIFVLHHPISLVCLLTALLFLLLPLIPSFKKKRKKIILKEEP
jgi:putative tricarboxylic transport membrane protein